MVLLDENGDIKRIDLSKNEIYHKKFIKFQKSFGTAAILK